MKAFKIGMIILFAGLGSMAKAQFRTENYLGVAWEISIPTDQHYLTKTSYSGGRVEYRRFINPKFSVGLNWTWNSYDQYFPSQTYTSKAGSAVTTDMIRDIYTSPIVATGYYYPIQSKMVKPYIGIGLGTMYAEQDAYFNVYEVNYYNWGFVFKPEAGVMINLTHDFGVLGAFNYTIATNKNSAFNINHLSAFAFDIGVGIGF
jgi:hypothetical protein